jgi:hypothetical protein
MTKSEAIEAMRAGKKVRHRYFSDNEWVTMEHGWFRFEDGVTVKPSMFWNDRSGSEWETDWSIFEDSQKVNPVTV